MLGIEFECDTYVLGLMGYGLILGMDWLTTYSAILDCEKRVVRLLTCHGRTLEISCDPQGSVMLTFLESLDASIDDLQSVPVVWDFSVVFDEVRGLRPRREIRFNIYLVDNAKPVDLPMHHRIQGRGGS